jgi:hypothetical protein
LIPVVELKRRLDSNAERVLEHDWRKPLQMSTFDDLRNRCRLPGAR